MGGAVSRFDTSQLPARPTVITPGVQRPGGIGVMPGTGGRPGDGSGIPAGGGSFRARTPGLGESPNLGSARNLISYGNNSNLPVGDKTPVLAPSYGMGRMGGITGSGMLVGSVGPARQIGTGSVSSGSRPLAPITGQMLGGVTGSGQLVGNVSNMAIWSPKDRSAINLSRPVFSGLGQGVSAPPIVGNIGTPYNMEKYVDIKSPAIQAIGRFSYKDVFGEAR